MGKHQASEGDEVQAGKGLGLVLVVASQAAESRQPGDAALDDPAPGQQHETALGLGQLDDFERNAMA